MPFIGAEGQGLVTGLTGRLVGNDRPLRSGSGGLVWIQLAMATRRPLAAPVSFVVFFLLGDNSVVTHGGELQDPQLVT